MLKIKYFWLVIPWFSNFAYVIMASTQSSSQEIKLTFNYIDGKLIPVVHKDPIDNVYGTSMSSAAISSVFLLLIIMLSFLGNVILVGTIASSWTLKR